MSASGGVGNNNRDLVIRIFLLISLFESRHNLLHRDPDEGGQNVESNSSGIGYPDPDDPTPPPHPTDVARHKQRAQQHHKSSRSFTLTEGTATPQIIQVIHSNRGHSNTTNHPGHSL